MTTNVEWDGGKKCESRLFVFSQINNMGWDGMGGLILGTGCNTTKIYCVLCLIAVELNSYQIDVLGSS